MPSVNLDSSTSSIGGHENDHPEIPIIDDNEPYLTLTVSDVSYTFEQIGSTSHGYSLRLLIHSLVESSHNTYIIPALMILKWQFDNAADYDWGVSESRGYACEYVAWQFVCHLNQRETLVYLLEELTWPTQKAINLPQAEMGTSGYASAAATNHRTLEEDERAPLLLGSSSSLYRFFGGTRRLGSSLEDDNSGSHDLTYDAYELEKFSLFFGLNALEIATIAHAKKFLSQKVVQRVIDHIWKGEIVFWDTLSFVQLLKCSRDAGRRILILGYGFQYIAKLERKPTGIGIFETLMYFWIAAFAYDEVSGMADAGMLFYQMDFWKLWNMGIIGTGLAFVISSESLSPVNLPYPLFSSFSWTRILCHRGIIGLAKDSDYITDLSFDILSLEALFLDLTVANRICSLVSLNSYFGSLNLIPLLCIRPLRLFLPAEHIRRVRIVLLRATHLPFVALIWAYESSRRYVSRRNTQWPPTATARGCSRPVSSIQTGLAFSTADARSLSSGRARKQPNPEQYIGVRRRDPGPAGGVDLADMIDEVERLRTQVERVAATVAFHHRVQ
ncbi:hypothetical protein OAory_01026790 [Aspergillus oryzae]|uniref:Ion transport domain-containing protein n=1 Tax=Aspergillus oryzae TaxID=5062 RepID=A0A1S9DYF3_ASPOZ|nr:uncharacterized protein G4B84_004634 [Aspergillus flavus NRRL3357]OOO14084.1 hypothetical protein OAory_01026790 [Aspergillus oryzae]QMW29299.1 hypothetical protein G4B84_004634 [Aspergillus flavus NRRL3357]QMW41371.1 hypothetical protein G4B11_004695 [Aspergillus flavus]